MEETEHRGYRVWAWVVPTCTFFLVVTIALSVLVGSGGNRDDRSVKELLEGIEGVRVIQLRSIEDPKTDRTWVELEFNGERLYFDHVGVESFEGVESLHVGQIGDWGFVTRCYPIGSDPTDESALVANGATLDFGRGGDVGRKIVPPVSSIENFLARLPEMKALVLDLLPESPPGTIIGESIKQRVKNGQTVSFRTSRWAYRYPLH